MPTNVAAWQKEAKTKPLTVEEAPYVQPGKGEILVKNKALAINPVDWKIQDYDFFSGKYPNVLGCDVAGEVAEVGEGVQGFKVGQRVIGHATGLISQRPEEGSFQEYTVVKQQMAATIPDSLPYEAATVLPLAVSTASAGLFQSSHLGLPHPSVNPKPTGTTLVVWGGSSSVGSCAIQLAIGAGVEVFTTASPKNAAYCKSLGASQVFDHSSPTVVQDIVAALKGKKLAGVYDTIASLATLGNCVEIVNQSEGSRKFCGTMPPMGELDMKDAEFAQVMAVSVMENEVAPAVYGKFLPEALQQNKMQAKPDPFVVGTGLGCVQDALDKARGGVSAQKLVVKV